MANISNVSHVDNLLYLYVLDIGLSVLTIVHRFAIHK